jgi:hypothetical protein
MRFPPLLDDDLGLPDLQAWVALYAGYDKITPEAWAQWENKLDGREARVP